MTALQASLSFISGKLVDLMGSGTCKSHTQILESVISLVLAVEQGFSSHCEEFLPVLMDLITSSSGPSAEWIVRKMAIDVIYTFAAILKEVLAPFKNEILEALSLTRTDKIKPVREASLEAIQMMREIPQ